MKQLLLAGAAIAALTTTSWAADVASEPLDVWSGFFVGAQVGYASGEVDYDVPGGPASGTEEIEGGVGGIYLGRNWQFDHIVLGLESSVSIGDLQTDLTPGMALSSGDFEIAGFSTSRVKVGFAFDNLMLFVAGGASLARFEGTRSPPDEEDDVWTLGWTIGGGAEFKFADNWSARVEYLRIEYDTESMFDTPGGEVIFDTSAIDVVRGGIAYHF